MVLEINYINQFTINVNFSLLLNIETNQLSIFSKQLIKKIFIDKINKIDYFSDFYLLINQL